ncbi:hypothetical protein [Nocardiopsis dassonvillei]|uniref:hypothetical protein n=1 Tax=Nocardiopsis dassonvillei TaxID=2014 RepID=UPI0036700050
MARILCVHGIAQQFKGAETLLAQWRPALTDGAALAGARLAPDDVAMAFYGDLFRPAGHRAVGLPPYDASDVEEGLEQDLLRALWEEAARTDPSVPGPGAPVRFGAPSWVQRALVSLSRHPVFAGLADRAMIADLKQVRAYLTDPAVRAAAQRRVLAGIGPDTRLVVAHSLGSVVAYEALCAASQAPSDDPASAPFLDLVTIGSPLGIAGLIFDRLLPSPEKGRGTRPRAVRTWTNVADRRDVVALVKELDPLFGGVADLPVDNGPKAHDASPYLTSREVGLAVAAGLTE